ncbi:MAG: hypothetical protein IT384_03025 [Deltaproteobacteria bacterium]|nr:hypothetical protein [Deltaproteobacteria bacterium]
MVLLGVLALAATFLVTGLSVRALLAHAGERRWFVAASLATSACAIGPSLLGRVTDDLRVATLIFGVLAFAVLVAARSVPPAVDPIPHPAIRLSTGWSILVVLALALVTWTVIVGHYFDEEALHYGLVGVIARGVLPPVHPLYPDFPFPYHYGFDALAAQLRAFGRLRFERAIDLVRIWSFVLLLWGSLSIGAALGGGRRSTLAAVVIPLGGSLLSYFLWDGMAQLQLRWSEIPPEWLHNPVPPVITNFFQPPQGFGMALAPAALLLFDGSDTSERGRRRRVLAGAVYLGLFSLIQVVFFALLGFGIGVTCLARAARARAGRARAGRSLLLDLATLSLALLVAWGIGGFFSGAVQAPKEIIPGRTYFHDPWLRSIGHHLTVMGLPLLLLPVGLYRAIRTRHPVRVALMAMVAVSLVVPNVLGYARDGSVVKFYTIGMFFMNVLFADLLMDLLERRAALAKVAAGILIFLGTAIGWAWLARTTVLDGRFGIARWREGTPAAIARAVLDAIEPELAARDRVFSTHVDLSKVGLLTPGFDPRRDGGGLYVVDWEKATAISQHHSRARVDLDASDLAALDVRFLVFSAGDLAGLSARGVRILSDPSRFEAMFKVKADTQERFVYRVLPAATASAAPADTGVPVATTASVADPAAR